MKKIIKLFILVFLITGCQDNNNNSNLHKQYLEYLEIINNYNDFESFDENFDIRLIINNYNNEYRYDVIIDNPRINMYHIKAIAKIDGDEDSSLPSIGILEDECFSLVPQLIDKENGYYKGINLSGISKNKEFDVLVYLTYFIDDKETLKEERYIKLYGNAT